MYAYLVTWHQARKWITNLTNEISTNWILVPNDKTEIGQFRKGENKGNGLLPNWIEPYERKGVRHNVYFMSITTSA